VQFEKVSEIAIEKLMCELKDDLGKISSKSDLTSSMLLPHLKKGRAIISNREEIVLCGQLFLKKFLETKFPMLTFVSKVKDGNVLKKNSIIFELSGNVKLILFLERTILNFIQHLSSISTYTKKFVQKLDKTKTQLLDTRKTTTGLRFLEKYATKIGGARNHRLGLFDKILIKDNHIKIIKKKKIKRYMIECDSYQQVKKCLEFGSNYILLDNMKPIVIKKCLNLRESFKKKILFEITGGISLENVSLFSKLGSDFISSSKITNSPKSVDIGLDML
jgi:nicotinate-nucleotide pyrophosphorylase